ncbi:hypothetical protein FOMPIDRAFT_89586 [Fomitopsis schrenkii]|uniref:Uncharacterized protein n=1 Tax=Fomitopsis schrenkii TaxID=2126942 RepID=S8EXX3_FOMSC|nr:hypothetical protein FOMPIDRAFT_89586 [Fomitopsis schrenkii]
MPASGPPSLPTEESERTTRRPRKPPRRPDEEVSFALRARSRSVASAGDNHVQLVDLDQKSKGEAQKKHREAAAWELDVHNANNSQDKAEKAFGAKKKKKTQRTRKQQVARESEPSNSQLPDGNVLGASSDESRHLQDESYGGGSGDGGKDGPHIEHGRDTSPSEPRTSHRDIDTEGRRDSMQSEKHRQVARALNLFSDHDIDIDRVSRVETMHPRDTNAHPPTDEENMAVNMPYRVRDLRFFCVHTSPFAFTGSIKEQAMEPKGHREEGSREEDTRDDIKRGRQRRGVMRHARRVIESPSPEGEGNLQESLEKEDDGLDDVTPKPPRKRVIGTKEHIPKAVTGTRERQVLSHVEVPAMSMQDQSSPDDFDYNKLFAFGAGSDDEDEDAEMGVEGEDEDKVLEFPLSESDASGSDYSATVNEQKRRLQRKHGRSGDITSDDETLDEDEEEPVSRKADKGKGRARSSVIDVERSDSAAMHTQKKPGPFSSVAKERIAAFAENVREAADQLAREFGKTRHDVLVQAGFGSVKSTRALNSMNVYRKWFSAHYPKADAESLNEYNNKTTESYNELTGVVDDKNTDKRKKRERPPALQLCFDWYEQQESEGSKLGSRSTRSISARMKAARDEFTTRAASYSNCEDMEVIGAIIYTGQDGGANQLSALFGGSDAVRKLLVNNQVNAREILDNLTTSLKAIILGEQGWNFPQQVSTKQPAENKDPLVWRSKESKREYYRRVLTHLMTTQIKAIDRTMRCVPWTDFSNWAYTQQARIVDWDESVEPLGSTFSFKSLGTQEAECLGKPYVDHFKDGEDTRYPKVERWPESDRKLLASGDMVKCRSIMLVVSKEGNGLSYLPSSKKWLQDNGLPVPDSGDDSEEAQKPLNQARKKKKAHTVTHRCGRLVRQVLTVAERAPSEAREVAKPSSHEIAQPPGSCRTCKTVTPSQPEAAVTRSTPTSSTGEAVAASQQQATGGPSAFSRH